MSRRRLLLVALCLLSSPAHAEDWDYVCDAIGRFAYLAASARDDGKTAEQARSDAFEMLGRLDVYAPAIQDEVVKQVFASHDPPDVISKTIQQNCLTPAIVVRPAIRIANLQPIALRVGTNRVPTSNGDLELTLMWEDIGHGHGHDLFAARLNEQRVRMGDENFITDDPANDRDMRRSIRFATGELNGEQGVLMLVAERLDGNGATDTTYDVYRLVPEQLQFTRVQRTQLSSPYCNADAALTMASGLPLRESYRGFPTPNGCKDVQ